MAQNLREGKRPKRSVQEEIARFPRVRVNPLDVEFAGPLGQLKQTPKKSGEQEVAAFNAFAQGRRP